MGDRFTGSEPVRAHVGQPRSAKGEEGADVSGQGLVDPFGRRIDYLRVSVTDRCDLRCTYCMPKGFDGFAEPEEWLTFAELERVVAAFVRLGVQRVRLTGGEPLVRRGMPELVERLAALRGLDDLSLSTNGVRLARMAAPLRAAGLHRVNVSLDSLDPQRFRAITGGGRLDKVLAGLDAAKSVGLTPIKVNMVVMRGSNEGEVESMVEFCAGHGFTLRLIETMPVGDTGRAASSVYVDLQAVRGRLEERYRVVPAVELGAGPARYVQLADTGLKVGFITPMSQHFCATCNRVRLAVDGTVYLCLGQEHAFDLRPPLRAGASDGDLEAAIREGIRLKPERHEFRENPGLLARFMSATGG
jgi:cyclic pyranopterin phosphate synthase